MVVENMRAVRLRKRRKDSRYLELSGPFLERLAAGESVRSICNDPQMAPYPMLQRWMRHEPDFPARFVAARDQGGGARRTGRPSGYNPAICEIICERLTQGEPLVRMCAEPDMPSTETVFRWLRRHEEFRDMYALAREVQGHVVFDAMTEVIDEATADTAYLAKVKMDGLRWQAARLAPRAFGEARERRGADGEAGEAGGEGGMTVVIQSFDRDGCEVLTPRTPAVALAQEAARAAFREDFAREKAALLAAGRDAGNMA